MKYIFLLLHFSFNKLINSHWLTQQIIWRGTWAMWNLHMNCLSSISKLSSNRNRYSQSLSVFKVWSADHALQNRLAEATLIMLFKNADFWLYSKELLSQKQRVRPGSLYFNNIDRWVLRALNVAYLCLRFHWPLCNFTLQTKLPDDACVILQFKHGDQAKPWLCHLLVARPWSSYLTYSCLNFHFCKMWVIKAPCRGVWVLNKTIHVEHFELCLARRKP